MERSQTHRAQGADQSPQAGVHTQPSPLQPSHLHLSSHPDSRGLHVHLGLVEAAPAAAELYGSQLAASQHSLKGARVLSSQGMPIVAGLRQPSAAESPEKEPSPVDNSLGPNAGPQGSQHAGHSQVIEDAQARGPGAAREQAVESSAKQLHQQTQQHSCEQQFLEDTEQFPAEQLLQQRQPPQKQQQPWEEAVHLLHSLACQISEREAAAPHSQTSQPHSQLLQPQCTSQARASSGSMPSQRHQSRQHGTIAEHNSGSAGKSRLSQSSLSQPAEPLSALDSTQHDNSLGNGPALGTQRLALGTQRIAQQHESPSSDLVLSQNVPIHSGANGASDLSVDVGGPEDIPGVGWCRDPSPIDQLEDACAHSKDSKAATQVAPADSPRAQLDSQAGTGADHKADSASADVGGQAEEALQDTEVEGEGPEAGQPELRLCLQLSSEDQDLACAQQLIPSLQPTGDLLRCLTLHDWPTGQLEAQSSLWHTSQASAALRPLFCASSGHESLTECEVYMYMRR